MLVQEIADFYRYGVGTREEPGNLLITQKFCRRFVFNLLADLLLAGGPDECKTEPDSRRPHNKLDKESAEGFRGVLTDFMLTAFDDLAPAWRITLVYPIVEQVFRAPDTAEADVQSALDRLKTLWARSGYVPSVATEAFYGYPHCVIECARDYPDLGDDYDACVVECEEECADQYQNASRDARTKDMLSCTRARQDAVNAEIPVSWGQCRRKWAPIGKRRALSPHG